MAWMKAIAILGFGAFAAGALGTGCSSSPDPAPPDPLATEAGFCGELAKVVCGSEVVTSCYGSVASSLEGDTKVCVENATANFCNADNKVYRAVNAQQCIDAYKKAYADAAIELTELEAIDVACHPALSGQGDAGQACEVDADCDGSKELRCVAKPGAAGSCRVPAEVAPGLDCAGADQTCEAGFYCSVDAGACIAEQSATEVCSEAQPCDQESLCVDAVCAAKESNGTTCTAANQCTGGFCDINSGAIDGRCKAALPIVDANGECDGLLP